MMFYISSLRFRIFKRLLLLSILKFLSRADIATLADNCFMNHCMNAFFRPVILSLVLTISAFAFSSCSSSSTPGSISPNKLEQTSFIDSPAVESVTGSASAQNIYNPSSRLDNEVAPGYLIAIRSNQDANLNGEFRISDLGTIELPYEVKVNASNKSVAELRSAIRDSYRTYFRGTPDIEISIKERKVWVRAQGLVNKPGTYLLDPNGGLDEVVSASGGLKAGADGISAPRVAKITADGQDSVIRLSDFYAGNSKLVTSWRGGESVFFQSEAPAVIGQSTFDEKYIHVLGQVRAPGEYAFKDQANFFYYLVQAGGPTDRANTDKILLISSDAKDGKLKTSKISLSDLEDAPNLHGGDVLFVQADNPTDLQRDAGVLGSLGGFLGSIATTILVGNEL